MRVLLGAGGLLKNCKCRARWYSTEKPFLPPKDVCEWVKRAIDARARRITHLTTRLRPDDAKEPETPALEIICRALASSSGSASLTNQPLSNKPPKIPLIPPENIKQEPEILLDKANSDKLEIFSCKSCHADGSGEDLETSDLKLTNCKNQKANGSVLKEPPASDESAKQRTTPKEKPQQSAQPGVIKQDFKVPGSPQPKPMGAQEKAKSASSQSEKPPQNLADASTMPSASPFPSGRNPCRDGKQGDGKKSKDTAPKRSSCVKENVKVEEKKDDCSNKQEIKESEQKKPSTKPLKEISKKCVSPKIDESKTKSEVRPLKEVVIDPKEQKVKPASSQSEKPPQDLTDAATMPSASPFPSGKNPCRDGKQVGGEKSNNKAQKRSSCAKKNAKVEKRKEDGSHKQYIKESEQKKPPKKSAVKEMDQKCVCPKIDESKTKSEVRPSQEVEDPKKQKVKTVCHPVKKDAPPNAEPSARAKEKNENCLEKLKMKASEQKKKPTNPPQEKPETYDCKAKAGVKPSQDVVAEPKKQKVRKDDSPKAAPQSQPASEWKQPPQPTSNFSFPLLSAFPLGRNPCRDGPRGASEKQLKAEGKEPEEDCELDMETEKEECIETKPRKDKNMVSCLNEKASAAAKKPKAKANESSDSAKGEMTPKKTKKIKPSTDHSKDSADLKPSESVPTEPIKEAVKASEKVMSEAQKASAAVTSKDEIKKASEKVITEAQKASPSDAIKEELKNVITDTQKALKSISNKEEERKIPPTGANTSKEPTKSLELKKFPAAPLKRTLTAYLRSIEPLLTAKEFEKEVKLTEEFEKNEGQELQKLLESEADGSSNWLTPRWTQAAYLAYQAPVTTFTSPALSFPVQKFQDPMDCLFFTARAIRAIYEFKKLVDENKIPVVKMGENVLDNSQFVNIFGTVRKPVRFCDIIEQYSDSDYVVVVYRNNLPILSSSGNLLSATRLVDELGSIIECPLEEGEPYGLLTHDNRDNWAEAYGALYCLPGNAETLEAIERSLFLVCLDKCVHIPKGQECIVQAHQLLHGGGLEENSANRWMDKTIQLIVNPNGLAGFCYEHSPAECQPLAMLMDYVVEKVESESKSETESTESHNGSNQARYLRFHPKDECINLWLHAAMRNITKIAIGLRMNVFEYECHGREFIKAQGLNSDSYIQMALQLAYYNMHQTFPAQYESAHLRMFVDGRTETIRSTSNESKAFVLAMNSESASQIEKLKALQKAVDFHEELTKRALNGEGIDRHLFGLQQMAVENCLPVPEFFRSKGFVRSVTFQLCTSQVATANNSFMAYGPLTCNGYGCCYNPQDCKLTFAISAWQTSLAVNPEAYGKAIRKSLDTMRRLILTTGGDRVGENPCRCEPILI